MLQHLLPADPQHEHQGKAEHRLQRGPQHSHQPRQRQRALDVRRVLGFKERNLGVFLGVSANQPRAGEVFLRASADVAELGLNALEAPVNERAEVLHDDAGEGQRQKSPQRELGADAHHEIERGGGEDHGVGRIHDARTQQHAHRVQVVGGSRHDVAGARALVEAGVERFQMAEQMIAQVELDLARDADQDPAREVLKDPLAERNGHQQPAPGQQLAVRNALVQVVGNAADEPRRLHHDAVRAQHGGATGHIALPVLLHVGE